MATPATAGPLPSFIEALRKAIADSFSELLNSQWSVGTVAQDGSPGQGDSAIWFEVVASGSLNGETAIQIPRPNALMLAQRALNESNEATDQFTDAHAKAVEKLIRTVVEAATSNLGSQVGGVRLELKASHAPDWQGTTVTLVASEANSTSRTVTMHFHVSRKLLASMSPSASGNSDVSEPQTSQDTGASPREHNMDILLGVELDLNLRFGQRVLTLREILELNSGSVIELDRRVAEAADILLGDKVLARGEVVLVDGNYGIRVTEVVNPGRQAELL